MTPVEPKRKSTVKFWFKFLANGFKSFVTKKQKKLDKSCNTLVTASASESSLEIFKTHENDSDSELEPITEKVMSFRKVEELDVPNEESDTESCSPTPSYQKMSSEIISKFLTKHGKKKRPRSRSKCSKKRKSQQKQSSQGLPSNISDRAKEHAVESPTRITKDQVCSNTTRPVGRFKNGMGSDAVCRDEDSEDSEDSENEMNLLDMNFSEMNSFERNSSMKLLNNPSLTSAERKNLCWEIGMKETSQS